MGIQHNPQDVWIGVCEKRLTLRHNSGNPLASAAQLLVIGASPTAYAAWIPPIERAAMRIALSSRLIG